MRFRVYAHKQGSKGAKALSVALEGKVLKKVGSKFNFREDDFVVNWGSGECPYTGPRVANQPNSIGTASNKLTCLTMLRDAGVSVPDFWTRKEDIPADAYPIVCRTILTGSNGDGIVIADNVQQLVDAPLYVKYVKKQDEYRAHVFRNRGEPTSIISLQRKAKRNGVDEANFRVRNLANGFVFVRDGVVAPEAVRNEAIKALEATGLAFGAVDVIWNNRQQRAYVLEINTAPGLEGQTVLDYAEAFRKAAR